MSARFRLRSPFHEQVTLDVENGLWAEPSGQAELTIGEGLWALPGLVDGHAHLASDTFNLLPGDYEGALARATDALQAGVMLVLDKGWRDLTVIDVIDQRPSDIRPDIETAGLIYSVEGGYLPGFARNIEEGTLEAEIAEATQQGRGWVKLVGDWPRKGVGPLPNFSEAELELAVRVAAAGGARVAIHTMATEVPSMAVRAGVHSIEHGMFLSTQDLEELGRRNGMWVPTLVRVETTIQQLGVESSGGRLLAQGLENVERLLPRALDAGVNVLAGTDLAVATSDVGLEAVRMWEMGMSAEDAVRAVSTVGFAATGRPAGFEQGLPANAVLFAENPIRDPGVLAHPEVVVRHGGVIQ